MAAADLVEVEFKGNRKDIHSNVDELDIRVGDHVIVRASKGIDLGKVIKVGRLVRIKTDDTPTKVVRKATIEEQERLEAIRKDEIEASIICKQKIEQFKLDMKLVDVEKQFDGNKITFYFTSDKRVDFRELVKQLASKYKVRIELRQIGVRDEARRIDGCGKCGRTLCCTSFIKEFEPITTQYAKDQNLPLNPGKLSGMCGRLMCCLSYEREFYQDTLKKYPTLNTRIKTDDYSGQIIKIDVFSQNFTVRTDDDYLTIEVDEYRKLIDSDKISIIQ